MDTLLSFATVLTATILALFAALGCTGSYFAPPFF